MWGFGGFWGTDLPPTVFLDLASVFSTPSFLSKIETIEYVTLQTFNISVTNAAPQLNLLTSTYLTLCMEASAFKKGAETLISIITLLKICGTITWLDLLFVYTHTAKRVSTWKFTGLRRVAFLTGKTYLGREIFDGQMVALTQIDLAKWPIRPFTSILSLNSWFWYLYLKLYLRGKDSRSIWDLLTQYTRNTAIKLFVCTICLLTVTVLIFHSYLK